MSNKKYLVINGGSSSLKFSLYEMPEEKELINGLIEKIGFEDSSWTLKFNGEKIVHSGYLKDHGDAFEVMMKELIDNKIITSVDEIHGVGHRVLHGGEFYSESVVIDEEVLNNIIDLTKLGPLHHPGEIAGIKAAMECMPHVKQVAVFDTAFHQSMPKYNYMYATPAEYYEKYGVRKYGFHGTSHNYITDTMKKILNKEDVNLIICHIGSGASLSAIKEGKCYNTTMGLTPLDGVIMGTRSGNIDPSIIKYIVDEAHKTVDEVTDDLNKKSGLLGICGKNDLRDIEDMIAEGNEEAILAYEMFENSIVKYIAEYYFELNGEVDAIVFTAGGGQNDIDLRKDVVNKISKPLGIKLDEKANDNIARFRSEIRGIITTEDSKIPVYVEPTDEEIMILRDTYRLSE